MAAATSPTQTSWARLNSSSFLSNASSNVLSPTSLRSATGFGKNLFPSASAFASCVSRIRSPTVRLGSFGGSLGQWLLQRAQRSSFHSSLVSPAASSKVVLQALDFASDIVLPCAFRL